MDETGNLYGTTRSTFPGTLYKVTPDGSFSVLYQFEDFGIFPNDKGVIVDRQGNVYGASDGIPGKVFKVTADGTFTVLYSFSAGVMALHLIAA
jgi:uncharacterized repeat protein (TIGR03803 family)